MISLPNKGATIFLLPKQASKQAKASKFQPPWRLRSRPSWRRSSERRAPARLTGAARGCVPRRQRLRARARARPHVAPPHAPRKKANRHAGQRRKRRKARRERSRAKRWRKRRKARPELRSGRSAATSAAECVWVRAHLACVHVVRVIPSHAIPARMPLGARVGVRVQLRTRASRMRHVRMRMEREREREREETGERERSESEVREAPALPSYFFYGI